MQRKWRRAWEHGKPQYMKNQPVAKIKRTASIPLKLAKKLLPPVAAASMLLAAMTSAYANPSGGQVTAGTGTITQNGNTMTITQNTGKMSINWQNFSIGSGETVNFVQPGAGAIALNRVVGNNASNIYGQLKANGQVFLINPNGVLFAPGAQVNVGGLAASTLNLADSDFQAGKYTFSGSGGSVINQGNITAANGGYVALLGGQVSNQGIVVAKQGTAALGAGSAVTLDMNGDGLLSMAVSQPVVSALAENKNLIKADGGTVIMTVKAADTLAGTVVNNGGLIQAHSINNVNGVIRLDGGTNGTVINSGTLDAAGKDAGQSGGTVKVLGSTVSVATGSNIDVSGDTGGGTALIGGNFHGAGPEQNAKTATVATGSSINADAVTSGSGGSVAVWSDEHTDVDGSISARGGANGGNGGQVETSGHKLTIGDNTKVTTLAPKGTVGNWLLDPVDFTIGPVSGDMSDATITNNLNSGDITILSSQGSTGTNGDINVIGLAYIGGVSWTNGTTLTLSAYRNINVSESSCIDATSGAGNIILRADNTATGIGTVNIDTATGSGLGVYSGTIKIYYNPTSYSSPTNYIPAVLSGNPGQLDAYMLINLGASIQNKSYDGGTTAMLNSLTTLRALPSGVTVDTAGATASFADKKAGTGKAVTLSGITLSGTNYDQYALNGLTTQSADIAKADLSVTGIAASNKTYDATNSATLSGTAAVSALGSDVVSV
ncbi:MAG: filamentous hemagglutinin N-terminal domain-containing protein, partial [Pelosinus sp.]|nr:filamentous hemagglutinin N-terminal domain-containing protein [Pelosinus sp.]